MQRQRESLLDRLNDFEATNRTLRAMLRERHEQEASAGRVVEQRDLLLKKLTETETRLEVGDDREPTNVYALSSRVRLAADDSF